jgi:hypothetical protein
VSELTTAEVREVQQHSESLNSPSTAAEAFEKFAGGVIAHTKAQRKEEGPKSEGKPFDLSKAKLDSPEYREWAESGTVIPKPEPKKESSEPEVRAELKASAARVETNETATHSDPRVKDLSERAWTQQFQEQDLRDYIPHLDKQAGKAVEFLNKHEQRRQIDMGLRNMWAGCHPQMAADFTYALAEIKNPGEVLAHIGLNKSDRDGFTSLKTRGDMRWAVHALAKELLDKAGAQKAAVVEERRPRAPKPPTEVGGRGAPAERADIAAAREGNFKNFDLAMRAKYSRESR